MSCQVLVEVDAAAGAIKLHHTVCTCKTVVGREEERLDYQRLLLSCYTLAGISCNS